MTKQTTSSSDMKLDLLKNLTDPTNTQQFMNDVKTGARLRQVFDLDDEGKKVHYGSLSHLIDAGVTNYKPNLNSEIEEPALVVKGPKDKVWTSELVSTMDGELYSLVYNAMGKELRYRISAKFDNETTPNGQPSGTALLRYIASRTKLADPRAQQRKAIADLENHFKTRMPAGLDSEQMSAWCDTAEVLNSKLHTPKQDHELIEATIIAMPDEVVEKIEAKTEFAGTHDNFHAAQAEWAGVIERHAEREARRGAERAMTAAGTAPGTAAGTANQDLIEKQKKMIDALTTQLYATIEGMGVTAGLEAAHSAGIVRSPHPYQAPCSSNHPDGDNGCWMMHLDQVPSSMAKMLAGLHRKRAAKNLPDLTAQFPVPKE